MLTGNTIRRSGSVELDSNLGTISLSSEQEPLNWFCHFSFPFPIIFPRGTRWISIFHHFCFSTQQVLPFLRTALVLHNRMPKSYYTRRSDTVLHENNHPCLFSCTIFKSNGYHIHRYVEQSLFSSPHDAYQQDIHAELWDTLPGSLSPCAYRLGGVPGPRRQPVVPSTRSTGASSYLDTAVTTPRSLPLRIALFQHVPSPSY